MRLAMRRAGSWQMGLALDSKRAKLVRELQRTEGDAEMAHRFEIRQNKAGEFVAYFCHNSEAIFWTEGYNSKASAKNAIESILKNGPAAEVVDTTSD